MTLTPPRVGALSLVDEVRVASVSRAVELEAYRRLGGAARNEAGALAGFLGGASRAHAWRAREWEGLLPVSAPLWDAAEEAAERGRAVATELLETALAADTSASRVAALVHGVYDELLEDYRALAGPSLAGVAHPSDGPLLRTARRAADDLAASRSEGEGLLLGVLGGGREPDEWARRCADRWRAVGRLLGVARVSPRSPR